MTNIITYNEYLNIEINNRINNYLLIEKYTDIPNINNDYIELNINAFFNIPTNKLCKSYCNYISIGVKHIVGYFYISNYLPNTLQICEVLHTDCYYNNSLDKLPYVLNILKINGISQLTYNFINLNNLINIYIFRCTNIYVNYKNYTDSYFIEIKSTNDYILHFYKFK